MGGGLPPGDASAPCVDAAAPTASRLAPGRRGRAACRHSRGADAHRSLGPAAAVASSGAASASTLSRRFGDSEITSLSTVRQSSDKLVGLPGAVAKASYAQTNLQLYAELRAAEYSAA